MAHFAELNNSSYVMRVVVIDNQDILDEQHEESEDRGIAFCEDLFGGGIWVQTSYNGNFRGKFAAVGDYYDPELDRFV